MSLKWDDEALDLDIGLLKARVSRQRRERLRRRHLSRRLSCQRASTADQVLSLGMFLLVLLMGVGLILT